MDIKSLHQQGLSIREIARRTGWSRQTVRAALLDKVPKPFQKPPKTSKLDPYKDHVRQRYEQCALSAVRLQEEIRPMGYQGSRVTLQRFIRSLQPAWKLRSQLTVRFETTLAMGTTCLAISAYSSSTEKASLQAIYLVGLQLPLSGAVLALPNWLVTITRPFIAAYWGWSGYLKSLSDYRIYDVVRQTTTTWLVSPGAACAVLAFHVIAAFAVCCFFVSRRTRPQVLGK